MFGHAHFFAIVVCIYLRCYITSNVHLIICALCEKQQLKDLINQKKKDVIFSSMFFLCIFLLVKYNLICILIILLKFIHHIITI
jgi:hypothetical protein